MRDKYKKPEKVKSNKVLEESKKSEVKPNISSMVLVSSAMELDYIDELDSNTYGSVS